MYQNVAEFFTAKFGDFLNRFFAKIGAMFPAVQKCAHLAELEECCQMHIFLPNFVLIQPRTSPPKVCKILQSSTKFDATSNFVN